MKKISVLIVDDSAMVRHMFSELLSGEQDITVVGTASDPYEAREKIRQLNPDVITLDIEMPKMDGLSFLEKIMALRPMPVIMVSSLTERGADATIRALEIGAFDTIHKPTQHHAGQLSELRDELLAKIRSTTHANLASAVSRQRSKGQVLSYHPRRMQPERDIIAIGASTGGVEALRDIFTVLPGQLPPIVITQHMPEMFTRSFAARLNSISEVNVSEAVNHERLANGHAYIAPGGKHLKIIKVGQDYVCKIEESPTVSGHRPSVDVLFHSVAEAAGNMAIGVILTGMGRDGADGLKAMLDHGAITMGQNQQSCVVYGMPQVAAKIGAVQQELPLIEIPAHIVHACQKIGARAI